MSTKTVRQMNTETVKILEKLHEKKAIESETNKAKIDNICSLLHVLPDFDVNKEIPEIDRYLNDSASVLENTILDTILTKLNVMMENNVVDHTHKGEEANSKNRFLNALPWIISVVVLVVGVTLGMTVFSKNQDVWYFALEGFKDVIAALASGATAEQIIVAKRGEKSKTWIPIVSSIVGILAIVLSAVLYFGSDLAIVERFTNIGKAAYIWIVLALIFITIVSAVSLVCYLAKRMPQKQTEPQEINENAPKQEEANSTDEK